MGKVVAGQDVVHERSVDFDDEEEIIEIPTHFLPLIGRAYKEMGPQNATLARETGCFGHLWADDQGTCPESDQCEIALYCRAVYEEAMEREEEANKPPPPPPPAPDTVPPAKTLRKGKPLASTAEERKKRRRKKNRGKHKDTTRYKRHGYYDMGRPVDQFIRITRVRLGEPPVLPKNWIWTKWDAEYKKLGKLTLTQTASYHTFLIKGTPVCRFWTNAAGHAIVDLTALLVERAKVERVRVRPIPKKMGKKGLAYAGRIHVADEEMADNLASWIRQAYNLRIKRPPKE